MQDRQALVSSYETVVKRNVPCHAIFSFLTPVSPWSDLLCFEEMMASPSGGHRTLCAEQGVGC